MPFPIANISILSKFGSSNESDANLGYTHFLEHVLFKGTYSKTNKQIWTKAQKIGSLYNAWTGHNSMSLEIEVPYYNTFEGLELLFDCFFRSKLDQKGIDMEKKVISEEIDMDNADQLKTHREYIYSTITNSKSLIRPILGTKESIKPINHEALKQFKCDSIALNNTYVIYIGPDPFKDVMKMLKQVSHYFYGAKQHLNLEQQENFEVDIANASYNVEVPGLQGSYLSMYFNAPNYPSMDPGYEITKACIVDLDNSVMSYRIREELGLTYSMHSNYQCNENSGTFEIFCQASKTQKVADEAVKILTKLNRIGIEEDIVQCGVSQFKADLLRIIMSPHMMREIITSDITYNSETIFEERLELVDSVTSNTVEENIRHYFNPDKMVQVMYQPKMPSKRKILKILDSLKSK